MGCGAEAPGLQRAPRGMLEWVAASREGAETLYPASQVTGCGWPREG